MGMTLTLHNVAGFNSVCQYDAFDARLRYVVFF